MTDEEMLKLASAAAGFTLTYLNDDRPWCVELDDYWNPLLNEEDALSLAQALRLEIIRNEVGEENWLTVGHSSEEGEYGGVFRCEEGFEEKDYPAVLRYAIVSFAAMVGRAMVEEEKRKMHGILCNSMVGCVDPASIKVTDWPKLY